MNVATKFAMGEDMMKVIVECYMIIIVILRVIQVLFTVVNKEEEEAVMEGRS